jgi:hypothetical protein
MQAAAKPQGSKASSTSSALPATVEALPAQTQTSHPTTRAADQPKPTGQQRGWGPGLGQDLDEGDALTVTLGKELFSPVRYHSFEVGPITVTIKVRSGEASDDAFMRAHRILDVMFEAEFDLKRKQFAERMVESGKPTG